LREISKEKEIPMNRLKIAVALTALALLAVACGNTTNVTPNKPASSPNAANAPSGATTPANTAPADELAAARKIYQDKCIKCHKADGTGGESEFDGVKIKAPNFTSEKMAAKPDTEFINAIEKGYPDDGMPAFKGKISDQEIKDLVKLIRKEFQKK
jgi:mono/diheme cytochrome c family protein